MKCPAVLVAAALAVTSSDAHEFEGLAPVPPGGVSWDILGSTEAIPWQTPAGVTHLAPRFSAAVVALDGKSITVAGFLVPLGEDGEVRHFALYASAVDCELHMPPGPAGYIDVTVDRALTIHTVTLVIRGKLELDRSRQGGVFYRMQHAEITPIH